MIMRFSISKPYYLVKTVFVIKAALASEAATFLNTRFVIEVAFLDIKAVISIKVVFFWSLRFFIFRICHLATLVIVIQAAVSMETSAPNSSPGSPCYRGCICLHIFKITINI
jgi:hypothetical protein